MEGGGGTGPLFRTTFPSSLSALPSQQSEEMKKKEGGKGGEGGGPPILSRLFLPLSRSPQTDRATRRRRFCLWRKLDTS